MKMLKRVSCVVSIVLLGILSVLSLSCSNSMQENERTNLSNSKAATVPPEENRFTVEVLETKLYEPMELAVRPDGKVLYIERRGVLRLYEPAKKASRTVGELNVFSGNEDGLLGLTLDPQFAKNNWIYLFYSPAGKDPIQRVSRFDFVKDSLLLSSEKILMSFPVLRQCCHSGGALEFGPDGSLYISVGDNTVASTSDGYAPIDERPDRLISDAQKSAANSNDLRGKILRIKPNLDGTYRIPDGNLFPKDGSKGRPEVYTMGNRNPFRISIDQKTGNLYWGEVGPDAGKDDNTRGPKGYDEVNRATKAGNFGWPYFVADNKPYRYYNFQDSTSGELFDPQAPINNSPNNTGLRELPPAQKALIYYPYDASSEFPIVGEGGRNAMAGPVFYMDLFPSDARTFPEFYEGRLFIYDWMREWIMTARVGEDSVELERFLPNTHFAHPIDMQFGADGALYVLEYGTYWHANNDDSKLIRIQYHANNRKPLARASADRTEGAVPFTVNFSSEGTLDYDDGDQLTYAWSFDGIKIHSKEASPTFTFTKPGVYQVALKVTDKEGYTDEAKLEIRAGNEPPKISIQTDNNRSFYWNNHSFNYAVKVEDREDGNITAGSPQGNDVKVFFDYLPEGYDLVQTALGQDLSAVNANLKGKMLIKNSDCKACHSLMNKSVGPSYMDVATRHKGKDSKKALASKIIKGGYGNWGEVPMAAHPQLSQEEAEEMVKYILGLADPQTDLKPLPMKGKVTTNQHKGKEGTYFLTASYTDKGHNSIAPITTREVIALRHPQVDPSTCDASKGVMIRKDIGRVRFTENESYIVFRGVDLTGVSSLTIKTVPSKVTATLEVQTNSLGGQTISSAKLSASEKENKYTIDVKPSASVHGLYFVLKVDSKEEIGIWNTLDIEQIEFNQERQNHKVQ
ncbi:PQQ-dependent sugar dehydrogenase [Pontibacter korlensis]|uniref:PQQ-dependent sugar dehydrogenase n=1 Tax=Pontibacter korlensis TaxID=400092 RepID=UPI0009FDAE8A|nr:PQQ-dependent sugar dehydrogenase [Pontibacter korlensis]